VEYVRQSERERLKKDKSPFKRKTASFAANGRYDKVYLWTEVMIIMAQHHYHLAVMEPHSNLQLRAGKKKDTDKYTSFLTCNMTRQHVRSVSVYLPKV
jgi:hypothetical protein